MNITMETRLLRHTWSGDEIDQTIDIATSEPTPAGRARACRELAGRINAATPHNRVTVSAVEAAVRAAENALAGCPDANPRASHELRRRVARRHGG
jgi:hypothetical protein